jgi:hypothetical protein
MLFVLFALMLFVAAMLSLFVHACRGVRVDDHPICDKCSFDLYGLPAASDRCPECGTKFVNGRTRRIGHRRRQPRVIAKMALWLFGSLLLLSAGIALAKNKVDWRAYAPVWLLKSEMRGLASMGPDLAAGELDKRLQDGALSDAQIRRICAEIFRVQANQAEPWACEFGDFVERARSAGKVSDADWSAYLKSLSVIQFEVPASVKRDEPLTIRVLAADRCGSHAALHQRVELLAEIPDLQTTEMENEVFRYGPSRPNGVSGCAETIYQRPFPRGGMIIGWKIKPSVFTALASGSHTITLHVDCETSDGVIAHREMYAIQTRWRLVDR